MSKGYRLINIEYILDLIKEYDIRSIPISNDEEAEVVTDFCSFVVRHHDKIKRDEADIKLSKIARKLKEGTSIKDIIYEAFEFGKEYK